MLDASTFPVPGFRLVSSEQIRSGSDAPVRVVHPDPGLKLSFAPAAPMPPGWYQLELKFPPDGIVNVLIEFSFAGKRVLWLRLPVLARNHFLAHFRLEDALQTLTLFLSGSGRLMEPFLCRFKRIGLHGQLAAAARRGVDIFRRDGFGVVWSGLNYLWRLTRPGSIAISRGSVAVAGETTYDAWIRIFDEAPERDRARHGERLATLSERPLMSILVVLGSPDDSALKRLAQSMIGQAYPVWELLLAAPQAEHDTICEQLVTHGLDCSRLRLVNAGINEIESLNALLAVAQSDYVLPLAEGSLLRPHALLEFALTAAAWPAAELIYADEDVIDVVGDRSGWRFKPAWSPNMLEAFCYLGQPVLMRRVTVRSLGGWRAEVPDAHHDLALRFTHAVESHTIVHLAKLLVHGAAAPVSTENNLPRPVNRAPLSQPRVSLIIPTRDGAKLLRACVRSIRSLTNYENYEILIIDNGSVENATKRLFAELSTDPAIRVLPRPGPFNFSALNNFAVCEATGSIIGLVNNDIEVTQAAWLDEMVALATSPETGCVGAKLLYPDGRIQHAGVVIGLGGVAGHAHRFARASDPGYLGRLRAVHEVSAVTAACLLIRREVFDQVGGLNESLTVAFNDVDFCLRVRAAGYRNLWTPFAELIHHESVSRGRDFTPVKSKRFADEYATMQRRWGVELLNDPYYSPHLTYDREDFSLRLR